MEKIIDLNSVYKENLFKHLKNNSGILSGGDYLKDEKIIKAIKENIEGYDIIIIPISILNIIEKSNYYLPCDKIIEANLTKKNFYYYVGSFLQKEVFIDVSLLDNIAILSYSKQTKREMRLNLIINSNPIKEDLRLKFIY